MENHSRSMFYITSIIWSFLGLCQLMSGNAAQIFNKYMAKQKVLVGTVTAEELAADLWGKDRKSTRLNSSHPK